MECIYTCLNFTDWAARTIDIPHIMELLLRVHAHEVFVDGAFGGLLLYLGLFILNGVVS
jgi:hypothetical protein